MHRPHGVDPCLAPPVALRMSLPGVAPDAASGDATSVRCAHADARTVKNTGTPRDAATCATRGAARRRFDLPRSVRWWIIQARSTLLVKSRVPDSPTIEQGDLRSVVERHREDAKRAARHYQIRHRRFTRLHVIHNVLLAVFGSGCFVSAFAIAVTAGGPVPEPVVRLQLILGALLALVVLSALVGNHAAKSAVALSVAREAGDLVRRFTDLLATSDTGPDARETRVELDRLLDRLDEATLRFGDVGSVNVETPGPEAPAAMPFMARLARLFRP